MSAVGQTYLSRISGITQGTLDILAELGYERATPVQEVTIPLFLGNKDVAVDACTGSGKTLAFTIPIVEMIRRLDEPLKKHHVGAIVISPTRELSQQIADVMSPFMASLPKVGLALLVGGRRPIAEDIQAIKNGGAQIIVGTPGRVNDVLSRLEGVLDFKRLEVLVLDEADRLLDMGFRKHLDAIMARLPKQRRTGLFSATQTDAVEALARAGLRNPVRVNVNVTAKSSKDKLGGEDQKTPDSLNISFLECREDTKMVALFGFLHRWVDKKVIIYLLSCACVDYIASLLEKLHVAEVIKTGAKPFQGGKRSGSLPNVWPLHGKMKQSQRESSLRLFAQAPAGALLCTDVAARGLDVPDVDWVLQVDPPQDPNAFVHRVGRTARMGREGQALVLLLPKEAAQYPAFLAVRRVPLAEVTMERVLDLTAVERILDYQQCSVSPADPASISSLSSDVDVLTTRLNACIRKRSEMDRDLMERGVQAMVSYVRGYKEHDCKFIFRLPDVDIGRLAYFFACLRLPRMPELKGKGHNKKGPLEVDGFEPSPIHPDEVKYLDAKREAARQEKMTSVVERRAKEQMERKAKASKAAEAARLEKLGALQSGKRKRLTHMQDMKDLEDDYALLKKAKKGKISDLEYDTSLGLGDDDDVEAPREKKTLLGKAMQKKMKRMIKHTGSVDKGGSK